MDFRRLLGERDIVLLDGATGTELARRGVQLPPPLWTAEVAVTHTGVLTQIHLDYLRAGCDIVTANTFRTNPYSLAKVGREEDAVELSRCSVDCARTACKTHGRGLVAGSMAPLEDCYRPDLVPADAVLASEHAAHARALADAGVDLLLVETMNTVREAQAALQAARATGLPVVVSFVLDPRGNGALLSGEDIDAAWAALGEMPEARLVNCAPLGPTGAALVRMAAAAPGVPFGAYANAGNVDVHGRWSSEPPLSPATYAQTAADWVRSGVRILGGCCYTTPRHLAAVWQRLQRR